MAARTLYSSIDLRGLPLRGLGAPQADTDAVTRAYLELRCAGLEAQVAILESRLAALEAAAGDPVHVGPTDPGTTRGLWVQTGLGPDGSEMTMWVRDGA